MSCNKKELDHCLDVIDLGCYGHCDLIELPEKGHKYGTVKIEFVRNGMYGYFDVPIIPNDYIMISATEFNENSEIRFRIVDQNDKINGIVRNWYFIKINLKFNQNELSH